MHRSDSPQADSTTTGTKADVSVARVGMIQQRIKKSDERGGVPQYGRTDQSLRSGSTCEAEMAVPSVTRVT